MEESDSTSSLRVSPTPRYSHSRGALLLVGMEGIEPPVSCTQDKRLATRLHPNELAEGAGFEPACQLRRLFSGQGRYQFRYNPPHSYERVVDAVVLDGVDDEVARNEITKGIIA